MVINEYRLRDDISIESLLADGFTYSCDSKYLTKFDTLKGSITLHVDYSLATKELNIEVLDDDYLQCYYPFYNYSEKGGRLFKYLEEVIMAYNKKMDSLESLVKI